MVILGYDVKLFLSDETLVAVFVKVFLELRKFPGLEVSVKYMPELCNGGVL